MIFSTFLSFNTTKDTHTNRNKERKKKKKDAQNIAIFNMKCSVYYWNGLVHYQGLINIIREVLYNMLEDIYA